MAEKKKLTKKEKIAQSRAVGGTSVKAETKRQKKKNLVPLDATLKTLAIAMAILGVVLYFNTAGFNYTLDDYSVIKENNITMQGMSALPQIFTTPYREGYIIIDKQLYRPISKALFAVVWEIAPDKPGLNHMMNILLYALTGFFLLLTLAKYLKSPVLALVITAIYVSHPVHTESVASIKGIDDMLSMFFFILTMYKVHTYLYTNTMKHLAWAMFFFLICMFSKESSITFIAAIPLMIYFFTDVKLNKNIKTSLYFVGVAAFFLVVRMVILQDSVSNPSSVVDNLLSQTSDGAVKFSTAVYILIIYLKLLVFPHPLVFDYSYNQVTLKEPGDMLFIMSLLIHLGLAAYALLKWKKKDLIAFGILFYAITFSISSNIIIEIGSSLAERFLYVPSLGFAIVVAGVLALLFKTDLKASYNSVPDLIKNNVPIIAVTSVIVILFGFKTVTQNSVWENNLTLYQSGVKNSPNSTRTHYYLGNYMIKPDFWAGQDSISRRNTILEGIAYLDSSIAIYDKFSDAHNQKGVAYYRLKDYNKAAESYNRAIETNPSNSSAHNNMGTILFETGQIDKALQAFQTAVGYDKSYADGYMNLGSCYGQMQQFDKAILNFKKAIQFDPNNASAHWFAGVTYQLMGDARNEKIYKDKARQLDPASFGNLR